MKYSIMSLGRPTRLVYEYLFKGIYFLTNHPLTFLAGSPLHSLLNYKTLTTSFQFHSSPSHFSTKYLLETMALGRGSALVLLVCFFVLNSDFAHAVTYTVGGNGGWTFNTVSWPQGKRFKAGDTLGM